MNKTNFTKQIANVRILFNKYWQNKTSIKDYIFFWSRGKPTCSFPLVDCCVVPDCTVTATRGVPEVVWILTGLPDCRTVIGCPWSVADTCKEFVLFSIQTYFINLKIVSTIVTKWHQWWLISLWAWFAPQYLFQTNELF